MSPVFRHNVVSVTDGQNAGGSISLHIYTVR